ncbi:MAG: DUF308 domain-containing protein [Methanomicrobiales archaeon]
MAETQSSSCMLPNGALLPWWLVLIQGIVALVLGCSFLAFPYQTLFVLVVFVGAYWFISGLFALISLAVDKTNMAWKIVVGLLGIIAGILIMIYPYYSTILLPSLLIIFIGVWGLIIGGITIAHGIRGGGWGEIILGVLGVIFGIILLANPLIGALLLPYVLGIFGIILGIGAIVAAFMCREK